MSLILGVLLWIPVENGDVRVMRPVPHALHRVHDGLATDGPCAQCKGLARKALRAAA